MNVVYNSELFSVLAYPAQQGFELVDKETRRMLFLQGVQAQCFSAAIELIPEAERTEPVIDALLDEYCAGLARPIVFH